MRPCLFPLREKKLEMQEGWDSWSLEIVEWVSEEEQKDGEVQTPLILLKDSKEVTLKLGWGCTRLRLKGMLKSTNTMGKLKGRQPFPQAYVALQTALISICLVTTDLLRQRQWDLLGVYGSLLAKYWVHGGQILAMFGHERLQLLITNAKMTFMLPSSVSS